MIGSDMFEYVHADDRLLLADMCNLLMTSRYTQHSAQDDLDYRQKILG